MEVCHKYFCKMIITYINSNRFKEDGVDDDKAKQVLFDEMGVDDNYKKVDDMILSPQQFDVLYTDPGRRNGYGVASRLWVDARVPYIIDANYSNKLISFIKKTSSQHINNLIK